MWWSPVADGVDEVGAGERVTVEPTLVCGHCKPCRHGAENLCENLEFFGCAYREGDMADVFSVPARRLHKIPTTFSDYQAALIEPLATPVHAVRRAGDLAGKTVAVLGAGTIGLLTLVAARDAGARKIVSTDTLAAKRDLAVALGAAAAVDAQADDLARVVRGELGESADVVFDCVANQATVEPAIKMAVKGGTVLVVGGAPRPVIVDLPVLQEYQVRLQGSRHVPVGGFRQSRRHPCEWRIRCKPVHNRHVPPPPSGTGLCCHKVWSRGKDPPSGRPRCELVLGQGVTKDFAQVGNASPTRARPR